MSDSASSTTLVINAGSSSIKAAVYDDGGPCLEAHVDIRDGDVRVAVRPRDGEECSKKIAGSCSWKAALDLLFDHLLTATNPTRITAVGHRIVHGGTHFTAPTVVTPTVLATLDTLVPLAPLHQPQGLAALRTAIVRLPNARQVACFDTAFHHTCPPEAMRFAIPRPLHDAGIRRYGFHGLLACPRSPAACPGGLS
jgi:acetate kinase